MFVLPDQYVNVIGHDRAGITSVLLLLSDIGERRGDQLNGLAADFKLGVLEDFGGLLAEGVHFA